MRMKLNFSINVFTSKNAKIDNIVFRLHYKLTVTILVLCTLFVTAYQFFGSSIECTMDNIPLYIVDTYCYTYSTYTIPFNATPTTGGHPLFPNVFSDGEKIAYFRHYQWVQFVLAFLGMLFYATRYLWNNYEGGLMDVLTEDLQGVVIEENKRQRKKKSLIINFFKDRLNQHEDYAYYYFTCEVFNLVNCVIQLYFINHFLNGTFVKFCLDFFTTGNTDVLTRMDPMAAMFPKITTCTFHKYGTGGLLQEFGGICVLPLNMVNEKIFIFLWFWFLILAFLSAVQLVYRFQTIANRSVRARHLCARSEEACPKEIEFLCERFKLGDWFLLNLVAKNIDPYTFADIVHEMALNCVAEQMVATISKY